MSAATPLPGRAVVSCCWPGSTIVCLGGGPSLATVDVDACRGRARVLAVNDAYRLAPWADVIFAADQAWWARSPAARACPALKYSLPPAHAHPFECVTVLRRTGQSGLEAEPFGLRSGGHSGYAALNLALHFGATRIILLGYDMRAGDGGQHHWFGEHPDGSHPRYAQWLPLYDGLAAAFAQRGLACYNASPQTAITSFPRCRLVDVLPASPAFGRSARHAIRHATPAISRAPVRVPPTG